MDLKRLNLRREATSKLEERKGGKAVGPAVKAEKIRLRSR